MAEPNDILTPDRLSADIRGSRTLRPTHAQDDESITFEGSLPSTLARIERQLVERCAEAASRASGRDGQGFGHLAKGLVPKRQRFGL